MVPPGGSQQGRPTRGAGRAAGFPRAPLPLLPLARRSPRRLSSLPSSSPGPGPPRSPRLALGSLARLPAPAPPSEALSLDPAPREEATRPSRNGANIATPGRASAGRARPQGPGPANQREARPGLALRAQPALRPPAARGVRSPLALAVGVQSGTRIEIEICPPLGIGSSQLGVEKELILCFESCTSRKPQSCCKEMLKEDRGGEKPEGAHHCLEWRTQRGNIMATPSKGLTEKLLCQRRREIFLRLKVV
nr:translation initiation factor IF-2-like [Equus asinus]